MERQNQQLILSDFTDKTSRTMDERIREQPTLRESRTWSMLRSSSMDSFHSIGSEGERDKSGQSLRLISYTLDFSGVKET